MMENNMLVILNIENTDLKRKEFQEHFSQKLEETHHLKIKKLKDLKL